MKQIINAIDLFSFNELSDAAKMRAINDAINGMLETNYDDLSDTAKKAIAKSEEMQTPWFCGEYIYEFCKHEIIESCIECGDVYLATGRYYIPVK